jgi:CDP-glucose 4,6-dehydratase
MISGKKLFNDVYRHKKVLITGHTGFKGTWMAFLLKEMGADVCGFSLAPATTPNHFDLLDIENDIKHIEGDIRNINDLNKAMQSFQPEFVFHLAAQALVKESYNSPVSTFDTNIMGSVNLLEAVNQCDSVRSLVYITSDKCYENLEWIWGYRENDLLGGRDPYSASKGAAEIVFSAYARSFFSQRDNFGAATTRAGNVIGGGDWAADRIIPDCIRSIQDGVPIKLRNPNATRPWQHVLEPINGYLTLGERLYNNPENFQGSWNFGPSTSQVRTVEDVANSVVKYLGKGSVKVDSKDSGQHEANLLQLNCDKAHQLLDWYPKWNVQKTLDMTVEWYKSFMNGENVKNITRRQLHEYYKEDV